MSTIAEERTAVTEPTPAPKRGIDWVSVALTVWGVLVYVFLFLPILVIVAYSFNSGRALESWDGFGAEAYATLPDKTVIVEHRSITSMKVAAGAAIISTVLGSLAGIALARRPGKLGRRVHGPPLLGAGDPQE